VLKLIIEDDEGRRTVVPFIRQEITIGRQEGNTIRLTERNVSRHHARLLRQNGAIIVEDLGSYNGVRVNGERIEGSAPLHDGDRVQIGDYRLAIDDDAVQTPDRTPTRELERPDVAIAKAAAQMRSANSPRVPEGTNGFEVRPPEAAHAAPRVDTVPAPPTEAPASRSVAELDPAEAPRLLVLNTDLAGAEFACTRPDLKIGRSDENDVVLDHVSLSQTHARMLRDISGEWQIVDLESSNGMFVNGRSFGAARLRSGDLLELGEVKLRFVAPGEEGSRLVKPHFSKVWLLLAAAALLLIADVAYRLVKNSALFRDGVSSGVEEAQGLAPPPAVQTPPPAAPEAPPAQSQPPAASTSEEPAIPPPDSAPLQLEAKLRAANAAMARRDFQKAIDILETLKNSDGSHPARVDDPLRRANMELAAKKKLGLAQKSLNAGKVDETLRLLEESSGTVAFAKEHTQLAARAETARRAASRKKDKEVKVAQAATAASLQASDVRPPVATPEETAQKLYDEGTSLYRKGQLADAANTLNQCLRVDPTFAKCHMVLGSTYAKLREPELGAQHYRRFMQLAPDDPEAARVKILLDQYESAKGPSK
jgi:pSer/pThr/pTyr-binding forkhead associated (FHA) protein